MQKRYRSVAIFAASLGLFSQPLSAQSAESRDTTTVVVESYYKIKWGSDGDFMSLYQKNHLPILEKAKDRGIINDIRIDMPFTHMAGGERWDLRVTITYRDAEAALLTDSAFIATFDEVVAQLKTKNAKFDEEEARRFSLLEEHWDVVLMPQL